MKQQIEKIIKENLPEKKEIPHGRYRPETEYEAYKIAIRIGFNQAISQIPTSLIADEVLKVVVENVEKEMPNFLHKYGTFLVLHYDEVEPLERRAKKNELTQEFLNLLTNSNTLEEEQSEHISLNKENEIEEIPLFNGTMDKLNKLSVIKENKNNE